MFKLFSAAALFALLVGSADAASVSVTVTVNSAPSTSVTCGAGAFTFTGQVAAGTVICPVVVLPAGWTGTLALGGADAASFGQVAAGGTVSLVAGAAGIAPRATPYAVTITSTP